jgi:putative inorganic carbon (HCO3(-)) transporter
MAGGLGAGLIAHFVFSMTDAIPLGAKAGVLFWVTLGLVVSLHRVALPRETR